MSPADRGLLEAAGPSWWPQPVCRSGAVVPLSGRRQPRPQPVKQHFLWRGQSVSSLQELLQGAKVCSTLLLGQTPGLAVGERGDHLALEVCPGCSPPSDRAPRPPLPGTGVTHWTWQPMLQHFWSPGHSLSLLHSTRQMVTRLGSDRGQKPLLTGGVQQGQTSTSPCPLPPPIPPAGCPPPGPAGREQRAPLSHYTRGAESGEWVQGPPTPALAGDAPHRQRLCLEEPRPSTSRPQARTGLRDWRGCRTRSPRWLQSHTPLGGLSTGLFRAAGGKGTPSSPMGSRHSCPQPVLQQRSFPGQSPFEEQKLWQAFRGILLGGGQPP